MKRIAFALVAAWAAALALILLIPARVNGPETSAPAAASIKATNPRAGRAALYRLRTYQWRADARTLVAALNYLLQNETNPSTNQVPLGA